MIELLGTTTLNFAPVASEALAPGPSFDPFHPPANRHRALLSLPQVPQSGCANRDKMNCPPSMSLIFTRLWNQTFWVRFLPLTVWLCASCLTSLCLNFPLYKLEMMISLWGKQKKLPPLQKIYSLSNPWTLWLSLYMAKGVIKLTILKWRVHARLCRWTLK